MIGYLVEESTHLRYSGSSFLEALQVLRGEHKVPLFPPKKDKYVILVSRCLPVRFLYEHIRTIQK